MSLIIPNTFVPGTPASADEVNENFDAVVTGVNGLLPTNGTEPMIGQLQIIAGTAAEPGLAFAIDANTGIYRTGADGLGIAAGGGLVVAVSTAGVSVTGTWVVSGAVTLTTALGVASGGTGQVTANAGFNALAPTTTRGDLIARGATVNERLAVGAAQSFLGTDGTDPIWRSATNTRSDLGLGTMAVVNSPVPVANGGTASTTAADARTALGVAAIPTSGVLPVGSYAFCRYDGGSVVDGGTTTGSNLHLAVAFASNGALDHASTTSGTAQTGTWTNISGETQNNNGTYGFGYWLRTA